MISSNSIVQFRGPTRWLSNFGDSVIKTNDGITYPTVEHAYQAQKTLDLDERRCIAELPTPGKARRAGQKLKLRGDWEELKLAIMYQIIDIKFTDGSLRQKLLDTGTAELVEGNTWGDRFWGVRNGVGENHLGRILMKVRKQLRNERV